MLRHKYPAKTSFSNQKETTTDQPTPAKPHQCSIRKPVIIFTASSPIPVQKITLDCPMPISIELGSKTRLSVTSK